MSNRRVFIRQIGAGAIGLSVLNALPALGNFSLIKGPANALPRSTPEQQGISSAVIRKFLQGIAASQQDFHSVMIVRHGHVVAEGWWSPYAPNYKQQTYSLSKSFTSTAVGLAVGEGKLTVEDSVISFFPQDLPAEISDNLKALKVKHLLSMSVGMANDPIRTVEQTKEGTWAKTFLSLPIEFEPGTKFFYNSGASYMLSAIVKKVTGQSAHEYIKPRLLEPLGISGTTWTENAEGINIGASHFRLKTEDMAKFGQLYLQKGVWRGKQILAREWVEAASSKQISSGSNNSDWGYGYGYQFWLNPPGGFRADGAFGQYSMIFPEQDAVVVITSESFDKKATMQLAWSLLPEMKTAPLPANTSEHKKLVQELKALKYNPPGLSGTSPMVSTISGKEFVLDANDYNVNSVSFNFKSDKCVFTIKGNDKTETPITCGINQYYLGDNKKPAPSSLFSKLRIDFDSAVAASATWKDANTLILHWRTIETTHNDTLTCVFANNAVTISFMHSMALGEKRADERAPITGRMIS